MPTHTKPYKRGDHFLMPYAGKPRDLLFRLKTRRDGMGRGHWSIYVYATKTDGYIFVPSCHRCPPSRARRILGK